MSNDPALYRSIQNEMENDTTEIHCAASVSSAVSCIASGEYCLLMTDLQLPEMNKQEMVRIFRIMKPVPILAISDHLETGELIDLYFRADEESRKLSILAFGLKTEKSSFVNILRILNPGLQILLLR